MKHEMINVDEESQLEVRESTVITEAAKVSVAAEAEPPATDKGMRGLAQWQLNFSKIMYRSPCLGTAFVLSYFPFCVMGMIITGLIYLCMILLCSIPIYLLLCCCDKCPDLRDCIPCDGGLGGLRLALDIGLGLWFVLLWMPLAIALIIPLNALVLCVSPCIFIRQDRDVYGRYLLSVPEWVKQNGFGAITFSDDEFDTHEAHGSLWVVLWELVCLQLLVGCQIVFRPLLVLFLFE